MVKQIPLDNPLDCKNFNKWDNQTVDGMLEKGATFAGYNVYDFLFPFYLITLV